MAAGAVGVVDARSVDRTGGAEEPRRLVGHGHEADATHRVTLLRRRDLAHVAAHVQRRARAPGAARGEAGGGWSGRGGAGGGGPGRGGCPRTTGGRPDGGRRCAGSRCSAASAWTW